ncbi:MAG: hypothetical protein KUF79_17495 [Candidatus Thiodiazotropha sp. (ex Ctena orbiculata)]|nr:hypothetical protein [Candidatus Thiodiazotropha taylori]
MNKKIVINVSDLLEQIKDLSTRLSKESDLGGVLISTSFLDACLTSLLHAHFRKSSVADKLLNPTSGTLGNYSSKCDVAYCLDLILKTTYQDLVIIGQTRNLFAHDHLKGSFNDDDVRTICAKLNSPNEYLKANQEQTNIDDLDEYFENPKNRFVYTVSCISDLLMKKTLSEKSRYT